MTGFNNSSQLEEPDYSGQFIALVVENNDPLHRQRIKVTIPELLTGDPRLLPWITPVVQSGFGMTASAGAMDVPVIGSLVVVEFQNGDLQYGISTGSLHTASHTPAAELLVNYPKRRGWKDPAGNLFYIDSTPGAVTVRFQHVSGTIVSINNAGAVTIQSPTDVTVSCVNALVTATTQLSIVSPLTTMSGDLSVTGDISTPADVTAGAISLKNHKSSLVSPGLGNSGVPVP